MAQTPALLHSEGETIDYTPVSAVAAGEVVLFGTRPLIAPVAIAAGVKGVLAASGIWKVPKTSATFSAGDALYWDVDGNPYGGTAGSGAISPTYTHGYLIGMAVVDGGATDTYAYVRLTAVVLTATIAGSMTADDITGSDSALAITGLAAVNATDAGGAVSIVGGIGGATSGAGGAITITSGAGTNNAASGAVSIDAGAKHGTGTAGAITIGGTNASSITFGKMPRIPVAAVTVGGTAIGNANALSEGMNVVTGADDTAAVILPVAATGARVIVKSITAGKNLIVFPQVGSVINNVGANNAYNMVADEGCSMFIKTSATQWYSLPLVSS